MSSGRKDTEQSIFSSWDVDEAHLHTSCNAIKIAMTILDKHLPYKKPEKPSMSLHRIICSVMELSQLR